MIIRSTANSTQSMLNSMTSQQNKLYELYNKINNNTKYTNISENPIDASDIMKITKQLAEIDAYAKNISDATSQINAQDSVFSTIVEKMQRINDLAIQAANSPSGEDGFKACALEIKELTETIVNLANSQYDGKYIFAGTNVTTKPFEMLDDGSIVYNGTPADHYAGYERTLDISDDMKIELNSAGDSIFGTYDASVDPATGSGLFKVLGDLNKVMNSGTIDNEGVREQLDNIQNSINHISEIQAKHSSTVSKLTMTSETLTNTQLTLKSRKAELSEVDLPSAISELVQQNYALQASMQAYSMIANQSLLDYLR